MGRRTAGILRGTALVVALATTMALLAAQAAQAAPPAYYPSGPQTDVARTTVAAGGWTPCYSDTYGGTGALSTILAACDGEYLMLAGGPTGGSSFNVLAAAPRADVIFDTGTGNTPHDANGSGWYYNASWSWGFAPQGSPILRQSCDTIDGTVIGAGGPPADGDRRLCWHTAGGNLTPGWRSGRADAQGGGSAYDRVIFESAPATAPCDATLAPVGCWQFDETSGTTAADGSTHANNGTYLGSPVLGAPGVFGTALTIDGVNDVVRVPDSNSLDVGSSFTLEGWIKRTSTTKSVELFNKGGSGFQLTVMSAANGNQVWLRKANVSTIVRSAGGIAADGAYHHVVAQCDGLGGACRIYIDGVEDTLPVSPTQLVQDTNQLLVLGSTPTNAALLDQFAVYDQVLTPAEIQARYAAGTAAH